MSNTAVSGFLILTRHFFDRFFDREPVSAQADPEANVAGALGLLAVPGAFLCILLAPLRFEGYSLIAARCFFLTFSMAVMGLVMVVHWEMLFPDRQDYLILTPLPLKTRTLFLAKITAFAVFLALFATSANVGSTLLWPAVDDTVTLAGWGAHALTLMAGGVFIALALAAVQGVLLTILSARAFRRVSVWVQTVLMGALVMMLVLSPVLAGMLERAVQEDWRGLLWYPPYWFTGLYERLSPVVGNPRLTGLAILSLQMLAGAAGLFLLTYLPGYRRNARRSLEPPEPREAGRDRLEAKLGSIFDRVVLGQPVQRAIFHFLSQTIARSRRHRFFVACYGGFGLALAVLSRGGGREGVLRLSLTLSFILVSGLRAAFNIPAERSANWVFQMSGAGSAQDSFAATRKWIVCRGLGPLFALLAPAEFVVFGWTQAVFHLAFAGALALVLIELMFLGFHKVPFTCSYYPGKVNVAGLGAMYIFGFTAYGLTMAELQLWLAETPLAAAIFFAALAAGWVALARWREREAVVSYEDPGDPAVRTLDLWQPS